MRDSEHGYHFSDAERRALQAVIDTGCCKAAAASLGLSVHTVRHHLTTLRDRYKLDSIEQLVAMAVSQGFIVWRPGGPGGVTAVDNGE